MDYTTLRARACSHLVAQHPQWGPIRLVGEVAYNEEMPDPESYRKFAGAVGKGREAHAWRVANGHCVDSKYKYFWGVVSNEYSRAAGECILLPLAGCDACCLVGCRETGEHDTVDD